MAIVRVAGLVAAALATGLMAGLFFAFSTAVMPALRRTDDRTFVEVMQRINAAIQNGLFALVFAGALVATAVALPLHFGDRTTAGLISAALALYALALGLTFRVNIPLNNALDAAGPAARLTDPGRVRADFEGPWLRAHQLRTLACVAAFALLCAALLRTTI